MEMRLGMTASLAFSESTLIKPQVLAPPTRCHLVPKPNHQPLTLEMGFPPSYGLLGMDEGGVDQSYLALGSRALSKLISATISFHGKREDDRHSVYDLVF